MNEPQYSTPLKTFVCRECGLPFDGPRRGSERRSCPRCRPAWREPHERAGICTDCGATFPPPGRGPVGARCPECKRRHRCDLGNGYYAVRRDERAAHPQPVDKTGWPPCPYCGDPMRPKAASLGDRKSCSKPECKKAYHNDRCREFLRDWTKTHGQSYGLTKYPEARRSYRRQRRAREHNAPGAYTDADVQAQYARQCGKCYWQTSESCKARRGKLGDDYQPDHVVPLILGGSNWPSNLVVSCPACNCSKAGQHPMDWAGVMF